MEPDNKPSFNLSIILMNLLGIAFLSYVSWVLFNMKAHLRVVAVYSLMMPHFISIWRSVRRCGRITSTEQWVFIIIAVVCWIAQSMFTGKLRSLVLDRLF